MSDKIKMVKGDLTVAIYPIEVSTYEDAGWSVKGAPKAKKPKAESQPTEQKSKR